MKFQNFTLWLSEAEAGLGAGKTNGECGESKLAVVEPIDWLLFLWQDKPVVVGAVVVVCQFNIWTLQSIFFGSVQINGTESSGLTVVKLKQEKICDKTFFKVRFRWKFCRHFLEMCMPVNWHCLECKYLIVNFSRLIGVTIAKTHF